MHPARSISRHDDSGEGPLGPTYGPAPGTGYADLLFPCRDARLSASGRLLALVLRRSVADSSVPGASPSASATRPLLLLKPHSKRVLRRRELVDEISRLAPEREVTPCLAAFARRFRPPSSSPPRQPLLIFGEFLVVVAPTNTTTTTIALPPQLSQRDRDVAVSAPVGMGAVVVTCGCTVVMADTGGSRCVPASAAAAESRNIAGLRAGSEQLSPAWAKVKRKKGVVAKRCNAGPG